jgi:hypothetical protein
LQIAFVCITQKMSNCVAFYVRKWRSNSIGEVFMEADLPAASADRQIPAWAILFE